MKIAGIEIGGTKLQIVVGNESGVIVDRVAHVIEASQGAGVIRRLIEQALKNFDKVDAVGVGFGGPVNRITGEVWTSYHVEGWTGFNIDTWLNLITGAQVSVDNDANVAALGEAIAGAGRNYSVVFYATLGSGVGGGIVVDGRIYHGKLPGEVEFGHVRLDRTGRTVQDSCSGWAVNEKMAKRNLGAEAKELLSLVEKGSKEAREIFEETITDLAFGLSHVVHLFHPDTIIIGGGLSFIGEPLRRSVEEKLKLFVMDAFQPGPVIQLSKLKADAVPVGALILAGQKK